MKCKNFSLIALLSGIFFFLVACTSASATNKANDNSETPVYDIPPTATLAFNSNSQPTPLVISIETFTPIPAAICPKSNSGVISLQIDDVVENFDESYEKSILDFLNAGGSIDVLKQELQNLMHWFSVSALDLTNDTVPEIIVEANRIYVFSCSHGAYQSLLIVEPLPSAEYSPTIIVKDMNLDGIPELVISRTYGGQTPMLQVDVLGWDNDHFRSLLAKDNVCSRNSYVACVWNGVPDIMGGKVELVDMDNGTTQLMITGGVEIGSPTKPVTFVWVWNGSEFVLSSIDLPSS